MSRLFRSFSFAFFPEDPSTIGIRVTWNKHQKLVRSPHSSRTSFSHWMQKLATSLSPHNFTTSPHRTMFSLLGGISGNFWSEKTHFKKSNHWVTAVLSSTKSLNMPTCQTLFCKDFAQFQKWTGLFVCSNFSWVKHWCWDFSWDFCQFFASHLGNQSTTKEKSTQETLAFRVDFLWSGWSEGWTMATCFSCHESKKSPSRRCNGFISKKHLGNNDQFCWWGTLMPSVWTLTSIITTAITSITITFLRFVLVARTSNSEPRWAAGCYSWSWKHLKTEVTVVLVPFYGFHSDHVLSILPALF